MRLGSTPGSNVVKGRAVQHPPALEQRPIARRTVGGAVWNNVVDDVVGKAVWSAVVGGAVDEAVGTAECWGRGGRAGWDGGGGRWWAVSSFLKTGWVLARHERQFIDRSRSSFPGPASKAQASARLYFILFV